MENEKRADWAWWSKFVGRRDVVLGADLYSGAGGFSEALEAACKELEVTLKLVAINHWGDAIETHRRNHPEAIQLKEDLDVADPRYIVPWGHLDVMIAAPECTHHANARGGKPRNNQSRMQPWTVVRWASSIYISTIVVENVKEILTWGPLDAKGNPIERFKGQEFQAWFRALQALNYRVEYRFLNAADYGAAQARERFFLIAHKGTRKITWPEPTHGDVREEQSRLPIGGVLKPRRAAAEIIDWSLPMRSIFDPDGRPLSPNTLKRIEMGLRKFAGLSFILPSEGFFRGTLREPRGLDEQFPTIMASRDTGRLVQPIIVQFNGRSDRNMSKPVTEPLNSVVAQGGHFAVANPFLVRWDYAMKGKPEGNAVYSLEQAMPTVYTKQSMGLAGFVLNNRGGDDGYLRSSGFDEPLGSVTAHAPMESVLVKLLHKGSDALPLTRPTPVITTADDLALAQFLIKSYAGSDAVSVGLPLPSVTAEVEPLRVALGQAFLTVYHGASYPGGERVRSINCPLPTVDTSRRHGFVLPWLVKFYGQGVGQRVSEPIGTIPGKEHFGLVLVSIEDGQQWLLDILFRMLEPHEYARAQGFAPGYHFFASAKRRKYQPEKRGECIMEGPRDKIVKQIGNAVEWHVAKALCLTAIQLAKPKIGPACASTHADRTGGVVE